MTKICREQWCLANQMAVAVQCLNSIYCAEGKSLKTLPIVERRKDYEKGIAEQIAKNCDAMALEDAVNVLIMALKINKQRKL